MNDLAHVSSKPIAIAKKRPGMELIDAMETSDLTSISNAIMEENRRGRVAPVYNPRHVQHAKWALGEARQRLAKFPDPDDPDLIIGRIMDALDRTDQKSAAFHLNLMISSFPNAKAADPQTYVRMLNHDVAALGIPDAVVADACQVIRRTKTFLPTIAEFLKVAEERQNWWKAITRCIERVRECRAYYEQLEEECVRIIDQASGLSSDDFDEVPF